MALPYDFKTKAMRDLSYEIALMLVPGIGCRSARILLDLYPTAEDVYKLSDSELKQVFGDHRTVIETIRDKSTLARAEEELNYAEKHHIKVLHFKDDDYPKRLNRAGCEDCPIILYTMGTANLNASRVVAVVGTRRATSYGHEVTHRLISKFKGEGILVVSGLAYGIDTAAHSESLAAGLDTVGVLGHGLDRIYPSQNRNLAKQMLERGGLVTEYMHGTAINPSYFPARNRIIAAMADATVVVEASERGGALITANMAMGYHRDVLAVPGPWGATYSVGCNNLIAGNKAALLRKADDLFDTLGWERLTTTEAKQMELPMPDDIKNPVERAIVEILQAEGPLETDQIVAKTRRTLPEVASALLSLELADRCKCLPGKIYKLI